MAASSPYQNNDYQAVSSFRPYALPINDIFKANVAQNKFWDDGALKVKNVYDNALGMNLTLNQNKEVRDKFMQDAEKSITKLSSMDLSDPSVQRQGIGIFDPLLKDKAIQYDNHLTNLRSSIYDTAKSFKNKKLSADGQIGEGFNRTNLDDALDGFQEFNANTARDEGTLEQLYQKLGNKAYTPYYNYSKDFQEIAKNCKGGSTTNVLNDALQEGFIATQTVSGTGSSQLRECLTYSLNDQAKGQIGIEARQAYKNPDGSINIGALKDTYNNRYGQELNGYAKKDAEYVANMAMADKMYQQTGNEEYKKQKELTQQLQKDNLAAMGNLKEGYDKLNIQDQKYVTENYDRLASGIYYGNLIDGFSTAYQTPNIKNEAKRDPLFILNRRIEGDKEIELMKEKAAALKSGKKVDEKGNEIYEPTNPYQQESDIVQRGAEIITKKLDAKTTELKGKVQELYNGFVVDDWVKNGGTEQTFIDPKTGYLTPAAVKFVQDGHLANFKEVQNFLKTIDPINLDRSLLAQTIENVESHEDVVNLSKDYRQKLNKKEEFPDYINSDGAVITAQNVQDALEGKASPLTIIKGSQGVSSTSASGNIPINTGFVNDEYLVNGKPINSTHGTLGNILHQLVRKVSEGNYDNNKKIQNLKNNLYGKALIEQEGRVFAESRNLDKEDIPRRRALDLVLRSGGTGLAMDDIQITSYSPRTGAVTFQVTKDKAKQAVLPSLDEIIKGGKDINVDQSKIYKSNSENTVIFDAVIPSIIDPKYAANPQIRIEESLNAYTTVLKNSPLIIKDNGGRLDGTNNRPDKSIFMSNTKGSDFQLVPYKDASGEVLYDLRIKNMTDSITKGTYIITAPNRGLTIAQVISKINE